MTAPAKVLVAMSGGIDSSVAAALLQRAGYDAAGVYMNFLGPDSPAEAHAADARRVADQLGIPLTILDLQSEMHKVIDYFADEYRRGRTPNPCTICNPTLKFHKLIQHADATGAAFVATGHYARVDRGGTNASHYTGTPYGQPAVLRRGLDPAKDQSYALFALPPAVLERLVLPNGENTKTQTRKLAWELDLPVQAKEESQDICFVQDGDYADFLVARCPELAQPGPILDTAGKLLGTHPGIYRYTIGQRRGLGVALGEPAYVVEIDPGRNAVVLGSKQDLMQQELTADDVRWQSPARREWESFDARVQVRYHHAGAPARVFPQHHENGPDSARVEFDSPVSAITPGQAAVFYQDDMVIGGGWIRHAGKGRNALGEQDLQE